MALDGDSIESIHSIGKDVRIQFIKIEFALVRTATQNAIAD